MSISLIQQWNNGMSLIKRYRALMCALALVVTSTSAAYAQEDALKGIPSGAYSVDLTHASVVWKVSHLGFSTYVGRFNEFTADLNLNSDEFTKSSVDVDIVVDSIDTAYPYPEKEDFNQKLSKEWFKSEAHPSITFTSKSVSKLVDGKAVIIGDLTLLGNTHEVALDVTFNKATANHPFKKVPVIGFSAVTSIDRTAWGFSKYAPNIGASVDIEIEGEFLKLK